jgi:hypothetical protein
MQLIERHGNIIDKLCIEESIILQALIMCPHFISLCTGHVCRTKFPANNKYYTVTDFSKLDVTDFAILYELNKFKNKDRCVLTEYVPVDAKVEQINDYIAFDKSVADYVKLNLIIFIG